uniref:Queuine tRNA-ribosyltransferase accessory subunit 2 n=1 Tax=Culicoides sonorensis TaxID=179676 RepID=A0A336M3I6_CULSO
MKVIVENVAKQCGGRICRITSLPSRLGADVNKEFETPMVLQYTRGASFPHMSREVLELSNFDINLPIQIPLTSTFHMHEALKVLKQPITSFSALPERPSFIVFNDPAEETRTGHNDKESMALFTRNGKVPITCEKYMEIVETFQPDFFHVLCDGVTPHDCSKKRVIKAVDKSMKFFDDCLEKFKKSEQLKQSFLIASIEGGFSKESRQEIIKFLSKYENEINGYFLDGFHLNGLTATKDDTFNEKFYEIIDFCIKSLPDSKLRFMFGAYPPLTILKLIQKGVDVFDTSYAYLATQSAHALLFDVSDENNTEYAIDLSQEIFKDDFGPLKKDCKCLACKNHTRAYVNHLMNCKELLGSTLLMIHNTHHYLEFFRNIRESIKEDKLDVLIKILEKQHKTIDLQEKQREKQPRFDDDDEDNASMNSV